MRSSIVLILALAMALPTSWCLASEGKILATSGVNNFEGSGGGGIVPWATLSGYATAGQVSASAFATRVNLDDFHLDVVGASVNMHDRMEVSFAHQSLRVDPLASRIREDVLGLKVRVYGNLIYSRYPQVSVGLQYKRLEDHAIASAVGAKSNAGTDFYVAASKLQLGAAFGYNLLWDITVRASRANQAGLLGFGGDRSNHYALKLAGAAAVFLNPYLAVGAEYRAKPDNLRSVPEDDWMDVFVALFPNKRINVTLAWVRLGNIAGIGKQRGVYLSLSGYL